MSVNPNRRGTLSARHRMTSLSRNKRSRRTYAVEALESRTLLAYTFVYTDVNNVVLNGGAVADSLVIDSNGFGNLEYSINGSAFSADWDPAAPGVQLIDASPATTVTVNLSTGNGSSVQLGTTTQAASANLAKFNLNASAGNTLDRLIIEDSTSPLGAGTYNYSGGSGVILGPLSDINVQEGTNAYGGGVEIRTGPAANTINVNSTYQFAGIPEPVTIIGGGADDTVNVLQATALGATVTVNPAGGTANVVNVGNAGLITANGAINVSDPTGSTTLNLNAQANATATDVTLDEPTNVAGFPFAVSGLSASPVNYGAGVTALNVNGGPGAGGVTYHINDTQANTTTTITGGTNDDDFLLSNAGQSGGLDHLAGPVVVDGGGGSNSATLDDSSANFNDAYTVTPTTVDRVVFAGLTYSNLSALTLLAENTLGTNGNNTIDINGTADGTTTTVNGQGGNDVINVNSTGIGASVNVITGSDGSTVNVVANSEPVDMNLGGTDTVNIGSTGGAGDISGIQGPISIVDFLSFYTLNIHDQNGAARTWTLDNNDGLNEASIRATGTVTGLPPGTPFVSYRPGDLNALNVHAGPNGNTFDVNGTTSFATTTLDTGLGDDTVHVFATGNETLNIHGQDGQDTVTLGGNVLGPLGMQGLFGTIKVDNVARFTDLILDDSQDPVGELASLDNDGTDGTVTGLAPATINYVNNDTSSLTVHGGSGGNTFEVNGTLSNVNFNPTPNVLNTGTGDDTVHVRRTTAGSRLDIHGEDGQDTVDITDLGSTSDIQGAVLVDNVFGFTDLTIDASADLVDHDVTLTGGSPSTLTSMSPAPITYVTDDLSSLTLDTGPFGTQHLTVDFNAGNPIPTQGFGGLTFNAGADATSAPDSHKLFIRGTLPTGAFASETHNAEADFGPEHHGDIVFVDAASITSSLVYTGLQPIDDTAAATNYTFNDFAALDGSFNAVNGPTVLGFDTIQFASTSLPPGGFETTNVANKTNVVFNASNVFLGVNGTVNITTPSTGLASLQFNTFNAAPNFISFVNVPAGVATSYNGSVANDTTDVDGVGVPAGVTLTLNGGAGINTLNYDAGGLVPTVTAGPNPGEVLITLPGFGTVDATNYQNINITNVGPLVITPGPARTVNSIEDFQLVDSIVGTFTLGIPPIVPTPVTVPASSFTSTLDWGDPSPDNAAGVITQDASNPSVYYITGSHTFTDPGTFTVDQTIAFSGAPVTATVNGVTISILFDPTPATPGTPATANVNNASLAVSAFPISGVEGQSIPAGAIASFIDAGGSSGSPDPASAFTATIDLLDSSGNTVLTVAAASIQQNSNSNSYTVNAPALSLAGLEAGTYSLRVTVTKTIAGTSVSAVGAASAVLADAPLTAGPAVLLTPNTGVQLNDVVVGSFTDAFAAATADEFTAIIDWGDGTPTSIGTVVATGGGAFDVQGTHRYARPGVFTTKIIVQDDDGSVVNLVGSATVTDAAVTGSVRNFNAQEGQNTGTIVLATFTVPNPLATVADITATLPANGWGDGTPGAPVQLAVQQIGGGPGGAVFQVLGSHTYAEEGSFAVNITITLNGVVSTNLTAGTATVADAPLVSNGGTVTGIEGNTTGPQVVATFTDANPGAAASEFTVTINWGDGTPVQTLPGSAVTKSGSVNGVQFTVTAAHTYLEEGVYATTITILDDGGSTTVAHGTAVIADAPLTPSNQPNVFTVEGQLFSGPVASFTDANPFATVGEFNYVLIHWGDGSPDTAGTITQPGGMGTPFVVNGTHRYLTTGGVGAGTFPITVDVHDEGGSTVTLSNTANVAVASVTLAGQINPASVSGLANGVPNVTNVVTPNFFGTVSPAVPASHVTLTATDVANGSTIVLGTVIANAAGQWNLTSVVLPQGTYNVTAVATDVNGNVVSGPTPVTIVSNLVIDTTGPEVQNVVFNRGTGTILVTYIDPTLPDGTFGSGVSLAAVTDASNYLFTRPHARPNAFLITSITVVPTGVPGLTTVQLTINNGKLIRGGFNFNFTIFASNVIRRSGVQDNATNGMDGEFFGTFPSGNGVNGGNFNARLVAFHNQVLPAITNIGTARPQGNGGLPARLRLHDVALSHVRVNRFAARRHK